MNAFNITIKENHALNIISYRVQIKRVPKSLLLFSKMRVRVVHTRARTRPDQSFKLFYLNGGWTARTSASLERRGLQMKLLR